MKKILLLAPLLMLSCGEYKAMINEQISYKNDSIAYFSDKRMQLLPINIDGEKYNFIYDTGSQVTILNNPKFDLKEDDIIRDRKIYGFDKKTSARMQGYGIKSFSSGLYDINGKYLYTAKLPKPFCGNPPANDGVLERLSPASDHVTELNYEKGFVRYVKRPSLDGYSAVNAKFHISTGIFWIELNMFGISDYFLFDTGNTSNMVIIDKNKYNSIPEKRYQLNTIITGINKIVKNCAIDVYVADVKMNDLEFKYPVCVNHDANQSNINHGFIKNFNWIIDESAKKAYYKPLSIKKLQEFKGETNPAPARQVGIFNKKLLISFMNYEDATFKVGDEIREFNNELVTEKNICDIGTKLNLEKDWTNFNIQFAVSNKNEK